MQDGDIAICIANGSRDLVGKAALFKREDDYRYVVGAFCARFRPKSGESPELLAEVFASNQYRKWIGALLAGTNIGNLKPADIVACPISLPDAQATRRHVGLVFAKFRDAEELLIAEIEKKRTFKRGLMQQLLTGQRRIGMFGDNPWVRSTIGTLFQEIQRPVEWNEDATYTLVSVRRRSGGLFLRKQKKGTEIKVKSLFVIRQGDILISTRQVVHGAISRVPAKFDGAHVSGEYMTLVPREGAAISARYFDYLSRLPRMYHASFLASYGVDIEKLTFNPEWYLETRIDVPGSIDEQERIVLILDACDRELDLLTAQRLQIEKYKRSLLAKLLSGDLVMPS